jgi:hypothetical protein
VVVVAIVVGVGMLVLGRIVRVVMGMRFREMECHAGKHQRAAHGDPDA